MVTLTATVTVEGGARRTGSVDFVAGGAVLADGAAGGRRHGDATPCRRRSRPGTLSITAALRRRRRHRPVDVATAVEVVVAKATTTTALIATSGTYRQGSWLPTALISLTVQDNGRLPQGVVEIRDGSTVVATRPTVIGLSLYVVPVEDADRHPHLHGHVRAPATLPTTPAAPATR